MNAIIRKTYFIIVLLFLNTLNACSKDKDLLDDSNNYKSPEIVLDKVERGYKQTSMLDMVLIYQGGVQRIDWTIDQFRPYVMHTDRFGDNDWFFDGFLFLEFQDGKGYNFNPGYSGNKNARKNEWEWLASRHFEQGKAVSALNACISEVQAKLGKPSFKHKIVIGLPEPFMNQNDWGEIDGVKLDFSRQEDRIKACKWYIDLLLKRFEESKLGNLELAGFYWVSEQMSTNHYITVDIGNYIREKGRKFYWIPYYMSNGFSQWKEYGFDMAYLQPNYFFDKNIGDERVDNACELAYTHNMGLEMEFDARALAGNPADHRGRLVKYIETFKAKDVFKNSSIAYYEGGQGIYQLSKSTDEKDKEMIDMLHSIIKERRVNILDNLIYQQDFSEYSFLDDKIWNIFGNKQNITISENGLNISSGGSITKLNTQGKIDMTYGRIEVKARILSDDTSAKIRMHMMPVEEKLGAWPASGELFMMCYDGTNPARIRVGANTDQMNENKNNIRESVLNWGAQYNQTHTFVCEWQEKTVVFYVDGMKVNIQEDLFNKQYSTYPNFWPFNEKFYFEISILSNSEDPAICIESVKISK